MVDRMPYAGSRGRRGSGRRQAECRPLGNAVIGESAFRLGRPPCGDSRGELVYRADDDLVPLPARIGASGCALRRVLLDSGPDRWKSGHHDTMIALVMSA